MVTKFVKQSIASEFDFYREPRTSFLVSNYTVL